MPSLTVRDIPRRVLDQLRLCSERERRSLNKEVLVILEEGLGAHISDRWSGPRTMRVAPEVQVELWRGLMGRWDDERSTREIVTDIRAHRSQGREVRL